MRSSIGGTVVFIALFIVTSSILFGWSLSTSWRLFAFTALLHFAVSEVGRRLKNRHDPQL